MQEKFFDLLVMNLSIKTLIKEKIEKFNKVNSLNQDEYSKYNELRTLKREIDCLETILKKNMEQIQNFEKNEKEN